MLRYTIRKLLGVIPTVLIISVFVLFFVHLIPGNPARLIAGEDASLETIRIIEERLGLNEPLYKQYGIYLKNLVQGDLGTSIKTGRAVSYEISLRYFNTVKLTLASLAWSVTAGVLIGVFSGLNRAKLPDYLGMTLAVGGISVPSFWLGLMLISWFAVGWGIFPTGGSETLRHLVLPAFTLGTSVAAVTARFTRSSIIEVAKEDYIRTAHAKGLSGKRVTWRHIFRNSLVSVVTVVGLQAGYLLGGSVVTESVFTFNGLGSLLIDSVNFRDYPMIQSLILIFALHFVLINMIVDLLYAALNPEIKLS